MEVVHGVIHLATTAPIYIRCSFFLTLLIVNNIFTRFTDDIKILVVHSRGVYNCMGMILEGILDGIHFSVNHAFFSKIDFRVWPFPAHNAL